MSDWNKRYDAAQEELSAAMVEWSLAESAMARANSRRSRAERAIHRIYQEHIDQTNNSIPVGQTQESR